MSISNDLYRYRISRIECENSVIRPPRPPRPPVLALFLGVPTLSGQLLANDGRAAEEDTNVLSHVLSLAHRHAEHAKGIVNAVVFTIEPGQNGK